ncbi:MAG: hypothetical protein R2867_08050 [Caldilineaceae bacterium]
MLAKGGVIGGEPMIGSKIDKPIDSPWIALSDLQAGDTAVWIGQAMPTAPLPFRMFPMATTPHLVG